MPTRSETAARAQSVTQSGAPAREPATPFLKWAGGKSRLVAQLRALLPPAYHRRRHIETFVGGGALFFAWRPERALLMDLNGDLIHTYRVLRDHPAELRIALASLQAAHDEEHYYGIRESYNARSERCGIARAACFIYLNKTCFNGLHRVNQSGEFNVPFGRYDHPKIFDEATLERASKALADAELVHASFERVLRLAQPGDFVYFDPPYEPISTTSNFTAYAAEGFGRVEQLRLQEVFSALDARGCKVMLSNNDTPFVRELYARWQVDIVVAPRAISCDASKRSAVTEVVARNYR